MCISSDITAVFVFRLKRVDYLLPFLSVLVAIKQLFGMLNLAEVAED